MNPEHSNSPATEPKGKETNEMPNKDFRRVIHKEIQQNYENKS